MRPRGPRTPRATATRLERRRALAPAGGERMRGYGVPGLRFSTGDVLAFRRVTASSIGPPYTTVWHRDGAGEWTIYTNVEPSRSCPRYFWPELGAVRVDDIELTWTGPVELAISVRWAGLQWALRLGSTPWTRILNAVRGVLPDSAWRTRAPRALDRPLSWALGPTAPNGRAPSGHSYRILPHALWPIEVAAAVLGARDMGPLAPVAPVSRLGDLIIPNRGVLFFGDAEMRLDDPHPSHQAIP